MATSTTHQAVIINGNTHVTNQTSAVLLSPAVLTTESSGMETENGELIGLTTVSTPATNGNSNSKSETTNPPVFKVKRIIQPQTNTSAATVISQPAGSYIIRIQPSNLIKPLPMQSPQVKTIKTETVTVPKRTFARIYDSSPSSTPGKVTGNHPSSTSPEKTQKKTGIDLLLQAADSDCSIQKNNIAFKSPSGKVQTKSFMKQTKKRDSPKRLRNGKTEEVMEEDEDVHVDVDSDDGAESYSDDVDYVDVTSDISDSGYSTTESSDKHELSRKNARQGPSTLYEVEALHRTKRTHKTKPGPKPKLEFVSRTNGASYSKWRHHKQRAAEAILDCLLGELTEFDIPNRRRIMAICGDYWRNYAENYSLFEEASKGLRQ